jgi:hypothetical protein
MVVCRELLRRSRSLQPRICGVVASAGRPDSRRHARGLPRSWGHAMDVDRRRIAAVRALEALVYYTCRGASGWRRPVPPRRRYRARPKAMPWHGALMRQRLVPNETDSLATARICPACQRAGRGGSANPWRRHAGDRPRDAATAAADLRLAGGVEGRTQARCAVPEAAARPHTRERAPGGGRSSRDSVTPQRGLPPAVFGVTLTPIASWGNSSCVPLDIYSSSYWRC